MKRHALALGAMATALVLARPAHADTPPSQLDRAIALAADGRCAEAMGPLTRAAEVDPTPVVMSRLGVCLVAQGRLVEGTNDLAWVLQQPVIEREEDTLRSVGLLFDPRERARKALAAAEPRIAKLKIAVAAPPSARITIQVDDRTLSTHSRNALELVDPGEHVVVVTAPGFAAASSTLRVGEGASEAIALSLEPAPVPLVTTSRSAGSSPSLAIPPRAREVGEPNRTPGFIVLGAATGVFLTGVGLGIASIAKTHDLEAQCVNNFCPPSAQSSVDSAKRLGTMSTIALLSGLAGAAGGGLLLLFPPRSSPVTPAVGLGTAAVTGSF